MWTTREREETHLKLLRKKKIQSILNTTMPLHLKNKLILNLCVGSNIQEALMDMGIETIELDGDDLSPQREWIYNVRENSIKTKNSTTEEISVLYLMDEIIEKIKEIAND